MKNTFGFIYSIFCYLIGFSALMAWIIFTGNFIPSFSVDSPVTSMPVWAALLKNLGLVALFGVQHSVMARKSFKAKLTKLIPEHLERSTYILATGVILTFVLWQWEAIGGIVWSVASGSFGFYLLYALFFVGWGILFLSSFLINHFDLFGLRQAFLKWRGKPYTELNFKVVSLYKLVRHPLYLGIILGVWCIPIMTVSHLIWAALLSIYVLIGIYHEEKDLLNAFGQKYRDYQDEVPKLIPIPKIFRKRPAKESASSPAQA